MSNSIINTIYSAWIGLARTLGLKSWELGLCMLAGAAVYATGTAVIRWARDRRESFWSGSSLWSFLGLRSVENRVFRGRVTRVFDGDTIEVDGDQVIRLIGVDAPEKEKNDKCRRDEIITKVPAEQIIKNGQEAHRWLSQALLGRKVELELDREAGRTDRYDRTLAHVWTVASDGKRDGLLAESLIWARHALPTDHAHKYEDRIREAFQEAGRREEVYDLGVPLPTHMRLPDRSGQETPSDNQASPSEITPPSGWEAGKNSAEDPTEENDTGENSTGKGTAEKEASEGGREEGDSSRKKQSSEKQRPQRSEEFWATVFSRSDSPEPDSPEPDSPEPDSPEPDFQEPDSQEPDLPEPAPTGRSTDRRPENQDRRSSRDDENESNVENPYWERP